MQIKTKKIPMKSINTLISLIACTLIMGTSILNAQESTPDLKNFKISIEKKGNEVILKCEEGCAWIDLTYENKLEAQAIDEYGMTELNASKSEKDSKLTDFLFTLTKTKSGLSLKGIEGTAWTDLSFNLHKGQKQMINQYGMVGKK